jgi:hypothetical protein
MPEADRGQSSPSTSGKVASGAIEMALQSAIDLHGPSLFYETDTLRRYLEDRCPHATNDIALLMLALEEQIPQALLSVHTDVELQLLAKRLEYRLCTRRSLNAYSSGWAVQTWAQVLRLWAITSPAKAREARKRRIPTAATAPVKPAAVQPAVPAAIPVTASTPSNIVRGSPKFKKQAPPASDPAIAISPAPASVDEELPAWATVAEPPEESPSEPSFKINPWHGGIGVVVAIVLAVIAIRFAASHSTATPPPVEGAELTTPARPAASTPTPAPAPAPAPATVATNPAVASSLPEIVAVNGSEPLIGDGKQRELFVSLKINRTDIGRVESRFVSGDESLAVRPTVVDVASDAIHDGRIPAGLIGLRTSRPLKAVFEYVVTTSDGKRSAPFLKELMIAAGASQPPSFVNVGVPEDIVAGKPITLIIEFNEGDGKLASIERSIVGAGPDAKPEVVATPVAPLTVVKPGTVRYPLNAIASAAHQTLDLTLIDGNGLRGEPKRIVLDVAPAIETPATRSASEACTPSSCGSIVSVTAVDADSTAASRLANALGLSGSKAPVRGQQSYEVVVRMDDRSMHTVKESSELKSGARVRLSGGKIVAATAAPAAPAPAKKREGRLVPESAPIVDQ